MMAELSNRLQGSKEEDSHDSSQISEEPQQLLDQHITASEVHAISCSSEKNYESKGNYDSNTINTFQHQLNKMREDLLNLKDAESHLLELTAKSGQGQ